MVTLQEIIQYFDPNTDFVTPQNWLQGRTTYGGLSVALALQTILKDAPDNLPPLKSAQVSFIGPSIEPLRFKKTILRQGKSATWIAVDCYTSKEVVTHVTFVFAHPRESKIDHQRCPAPPTHPPEYFPGLERRASIPAFLSNFDVRFIGPSTPVSGSDHPELIAWIRHINHAIIDPAVALLALGDSLPIAVISCFTEFHPMSSMTWSIDLPQPATYDEWFLLRSSSKQAQNGYSFQTMSMWNREGKLITSGNQTVAFFA